MFLESYSSKNIAIVKFSMSMYKSIISQNTIKISIMSLDNSISYEFDMEGVWLDSSWVLLNFTEIQGIFGS